MNPDSELDIPLTFDEAARLALFLAERGHRDAAAAVIARPVHEIMHAAASEVTA
jgi:hypothetical protein